MKREKMMEVLENNKVEDASNHFESNKRVRLAKAHGVIHLYATATSIGVAIGSFAPGLSILGSAACFPLGVSRTVSSLAKLFNYELDETSKTAILSGIFGYVVALLGLIAISGSIPVAGGVISASTAFVTLESVGWGVYFIFDSGVEIASLSKSEIVYLMRKGRLYAEIGERADGLDWLNEMPSHIKTRYIHLTKSVEYSNLSEEQQQSLLEEIEDLLKPHLFSEKGLTEFFAERHS